MLEDDVQIWGDGSTFKGNDIERFYRYGLLANPNLRIYKPWLDAAFVGELGGRREMSAWLLAHDLPYRDSAEKAYSTDANIWGATHEPNPRAPRHRDRDGRADHGRAVLGPGGRDRAGGRHDRRSSGARPVTVNGARFDAQVNLVMAANAIGGSTAWACPTRSRTGSSRPKSRGIYEAPGMALLHVAYERLVNAIHNEETIANYHTEGRRLGRLMYEGRWLDPQALMLRESLQRWVGSAVTGEVTLRLRRGEDYSILDSAGPVFSYHPDKLSMERTEDSAFGPLDRIGQLTMRNLDIADSRAKLEQYAGLGMVGSAHVQLIGAGASSELVGTCRRSRGDHVPRHGERTAPRPRRDGTRYRLTGLPGAASARGAMLPGGQCPSGGQRRAASARAGGDPGRVPPDPAGASAGLAPAPSAITSPPPWMVVVRPGGPLHSQRR